MLLALSTLCEHPKRRTGLTSLFHELVEHSLEQFPDVDWLIIADQEYDWQIHSARVKVDRSFSGNQRLLNRLIADHFLVPRSVKSQGADALITVGFSPFYKALPIAMHMLVLTQFAPGDNSMRAIYRRWASSSGLNNADLVITNSQWAASEITARFPHSKERMLVSYEGLQHEVFSPERLDGEIEAIKKEFDLNPGYLLWVSNFYAYKQAELLLDAYARLSAEHRAAHPLVMVGGAWDTGAVKAKSHAKDLGIENDVRFAGWLGDQWIAPMYRNAAVFCLPSREETFGRSVLEAMACGTVCLVNDIPIMREVTAGQAVIIDFKNTEAAGNALASALFDDQLRDQLRHGGLQRAKQFSFDILANERVTAIKQMLVNRRH